MENSKTQNVDNFKFEPIKGYPMLHWKGKRPFESTSYYPAQLKEIHGQHDENGWMNKIYWGDNLQVMSHLLKDFRGKIRLIYIDPPFDSKADYKKEIRLKNQTLTNEYSAFEEKQYSDIWTNDQYLQFMYERLILLRELLTNDGSIYLHCDWHKSHLLRCILDEIFGTENFRGEIVWKRTFNSGSSKGLSNKFPTNTDTIFWYSKSEQYIFNKLFRPYSEGALKRYDKVDEKGRRFKWNPMKTYSQEKLEKLIAAGEAKIIPTSKYPVYKKYLDESKGTPMDNLWDDIPAMGTFAPERQNYPTQKPEALLERIIKVASNPGDIVFDCFMGSGTTQAVAMKLGRRFIGCDINLGAIQTTTKRLLNIMRENPDLKTGFEVYNVNNYEFFRNPVQAKELLIEALEIQPLPHNSLYDGELDGRMVKIMPINRITTKADLGELIQNFDYKLFEKRREERPNQPVEKLLLVCMGHEPDLKSFLQKQVPYKLDIEIVDILRDRQDLQFKREAEADIVIENGKLVIKSFYPMNLLQKLSLIRENVEDWRELVDSIMIDWNYDGAVLEPSVVDVPDKNELVKGVYDISENAGTIKVKITDLLSESLEVEIDNG
ncbi:site-specific DNA-methyltransferase [Aeribacillus pallidus]|uniref:site-specific DNA-methyltransferase n=1 Tax=Aeribacillus pallidus TaxID=33936 RepID=UPI003D223D88